jgi:hypothetical protein
MAELHDSPDHKAFRAAFTKSDTAGEVLEAPVGFFGDLEKFGAPGSLRVVAQPLVSTVNKRRDTVGQLRSAENCASHMP